MCDQLNWNIDTTPPTNHTPTNHTQEVYFYLCGMACLIGMKFGMCALSGLEGFKINNRITLSLLECDSSCV